MMVWAALECRLDNGSGSCKGAVGRWEGAACSMHPLGRRRPLQTTRCGPCVWWVVRGLGFRVEGFGPKIKFKLM